MIDDYQADSDDDKNKHNACLQNEKLDLVLVFIHSSI